MPVSPGLGNRFIEIDVVGMKRVRSFKQREGDNSKNKRALVHLF